MSIAQVIQKGAAALDLITGNQTRNVNAGNNGMPGNNVSFLDMLVTQITHQNPMEPMNNVEMVTQMTQFQTLEKLDTLNERMGSMIVYQNMMNSINLLGKEVAVSDPSTGNIITGKVDGIKIEYGFPGIVVNGSYYDFNDVVGIK